MGSGVTVTFPTVTAGGDTTVTTSTAGPPPPTGFRIVGTGQPVYYDINTSASFTGTATVCIEYADQPQEGNLKLQKFNPPSRTLRSLSIPTTTSSAARRHRFRSSLLRNRCHQILSAESRQARTLRCARWGRLKRPAASACSRGPSRRAQARSRSVARRGGRGGERRSRRRPGLGDPALGARSYRAQTNTAPCTVLSGSSDAAFAQPSLPRSGR